MTLDRSVDQAIREAVTEAGQPEELARYIIAWVTAVNDGNEDLSLSDGALRRLDLLYSATIVKALEDVL